jgi:hypothetical protein
MLIILTGLESSQLTGTEKLLLLAFLIHQKDTLSMSKVAMVLRRHLVLCSTSQVGHLVGCDDAVGMLLLTHHVCGMMELVTACVS